MDEQTSTGLYALIALVLTVLCMFVFWPLACLFGFVFQLCLTEYIARDVARKVYANGGK